MERLDGSAREVHQFVARRVSNRMDAEDIAQQSLLKACQKLSACRGDNLRAWLLTIARHLIVDHFRSQRRFEFVEAEEAARSERERALQSAPDVVQEVCANREHLRCYFECLSNRLRLEEQIAVLLADVHGYRDKDAAAEMGVGLPSFKLLLHGARARLHECAWGRCALVRNGHSTVRHGPHPDARNGHGHRNGKPVNGGHNSPATEKNGRANHPPVDDRPDVFANRHCPGRVTGSLCAAGGNGHGHDFASRGDAVSRPGFESFCPNAAGGCSKKCCLGVSCRLGLRCSRVVPKLVALRDRLLAAVGGGALLRAAEVSSCPVNELAALWRNAEAAAQWVVMV